MAQNDENGFSFKKVVELKTSEEVALPVPMMYPPPGALATSGRPFSVPPVTLVLAREASKPVAAKVEAREFILLAKEHSIGNSNEFQLKVSPEQEIFFNKSAAQINSSWNGSRNNP